MNIQLKQKIIGAIIIIIFLAVAIPLLLSGTKNKNNSNTVTPASSTTQQIPITTVTTEPTQPVTMEATAAPIPEPTPVAAAAPTPTSGTSVTTGTTSTEVTPATTTTTNNVDAPVGTKTLAPTSSPENTVLSTPSIEQTPGLQESLSQKESEIASGNIQKKPHKVAITKSKKNKESKNNYQAKNLEKKAWLIDLGGYSSNQKAQNLVNKLKRDGYHAYSKKVKAKHKNLNVVLVGPVKNQAKAKGLAQKIAKNFGIKAKVIPIIPKQK